MLLEVEVSALDSVVERDELLDRVIADWLGDSIGHWDRRSQSLGGTAPEETS